MTWNQWVSSVLGAMVVACTIPKNVGDAPESGSDDDGVDDGSAGSSSGGGNDVCPDSPNFACSARPECDAMNCGDAFSAFEANGCPRPACGANDTCAAGSTCFHPSDYGGCVPSANGCEDNDQGACQCGGTADCQGSYCLPDDERPPLDCFGIADEGDCFAHGCNYFETVTVMTDTCTCEPSTPACLYFPGGEMGGAAAPNGFFHVETQTMAVFDTDWQVPPLGWAKCSAADAPQSCSCYEPFGPIMCL
jgi:hypothetical protein